MKSRSVGATTMEAAKQTKKALIGNAPATPEQDSPEKLEAMLAAYARYGTFASSRKARLAELMARRSAKRWDQAKKAQMTRRYIEATNGTDEALEVIETLRSRLAALSTPAA